jgi:hypothetical protein
MCRTKVEASGDKKKILSQLHYGFTTSHATPSLNDGRPGSVFVKETWFSEDNHLGTEGVHLRYTGVGIIYLFFMFF